MKKLISVVLATYNGEKYIRQQLDSILGQTLVPDEILVGDDCSSDSTLDILKEYASRYTTIKYKKNESNQGYAQNFWSLAHEAKGDYIFFSDQDDCWYESKIKDMIDLFEENKSILALNTAYDYIDAAGDAIIDYKLKSFKNTGKLRKISFEDFVKSPRFLGMAMAIRKELLDKVVSNDIEKVHAHDWCLNHTAAANDGMYFCDKVLSSYRQHGNNTFGTSANVASDEMMNRRLKVIDEELLLSEILDEVYKNTVHEKYVISHKRTVINRKKLFQNKKVIGLLFQYVVEKKYLAFRGLLGDIYVIKNSMKKN